MHNIVTKYEISDRWLWVNVNVAPIIHYERFAFQKIEATFHKNQPISKGWTGTEKFEPGGGKKKPFRSLTANNKLKYNNKLKNLLLQTTIRKMVERNPSSES